jgi:predicted nucleotidyltransferase
MTTTSPSSTVEVSPDRPVHPVTIALLRHVRDAAQQLGSEFAVAGATARDIVLWHVYGIRAERATRDVDVAVCAVSWDAHRELTSRLEATGLFTARGLSTHWFSRTHRSVSSLRSTSCPSGRLRLLREQSNGQKTRPR